MMQNVFEKIIKRLKELKTDNSCRSCQYREKCNEVQETASESTDLCGATMKSLAIKIVNQVAKEYEHDFCEWKKYEDKRINYYKNCRWRDEDIDEFTVKHFYYCPYCGKKIKVIEPYKAESEE